MLNKETLKRKSLWINCISKGKINEQTNFGIHSWIIWRTMHADGDGFLLFTFEQIALFLFYALLKIVGVGKQIYFSYIALFSKLIVSSRGELSGGFALFLLVLEVHCHQKIPTDIWKDAKLPGMISTNYSKILKVYFR